MQRHVVQVLRVAQERPRHAALADQLLGRVVVLGERERRVGVGAQERRVDDRACTPASTAARTACACSTTRSAASARRHQEQRRRSRPAPRSARPGRGSRAAPSRPASKPATGAAPAPGRARPAAGARRRRASSSRHARAHVPPVAPVTAIVRHTNSSVPIQAMNATSTSALNNPNKIRWRASRAAAARRPRRRAAGRPASARRAPRSTPDRGTSTSRGPAASMSGTSKPAERLSIDGTPSSSSSPWINSASAWLRPAATFVSGPSESCGLILRARSCSVGELDVAGAVDGAGVDERHAAVAAEALVERVGRGAATGRRAGRQAAAASSTSTSASVDRPVRVDAPVADLRLVAGGARRSATRRPGQLTREVDVGLRRPRLGARVRVVDDRLAAVLVVDVAQRQEVARPDLEAERARRLVLDRRRPPRPRRRAARRTRSTRSARHAGRGRRSAAGGPGRCASDPGQ